MKIFLSVFLCLFLLSCLCIAYDVKSSEIQSIIKKYDGKIPEYWKETVPGVIAHFNAPEKVIALTFDACGRSKRSSSYDAKLIDFLCENKIPATLFITSLWIKANPEIFKELAKNPLFEIANHGANHLPCSVNGNSAYGIKGTKNIPALIHEVLGNKELIEELTGKTPRFYRSGTNYYDEIAVRIVYDLGQIPVGYSVLGDAGATYNQDQVKAALLSAKSGDIVIMHMNHPEGETAEGVIAAIPILKEQGFKFEKLSLVLGLTQRPKN